MEAFDAAVAWWDTANSMMALMNVGGLVLFFVWVVMVMAEAHRAVLASLSVAIVASMVMPFLLTLDAEREVQAACAALSMDVQSRDIRLSSLDEHNIGAHCGATTVREIVNQARAT